MVQEVTSTSWGKRIINALWSTIIGIVLIIAGIYFVFWNENNSLHTSQSLQQTEQVTITIPNTPLDAKNEMKVVYLTGLATTTNVLSDKLFNVSETAIQLHRNVEMYQWEENTETSTEKQMGGSEKQVKTYTYQKIWSNNKIASDEFKEPNGHQNPATMPIQSKTQYAKNVTLGDFNLPSSLIKQISGEVAVDLNKADLSALQIKYNKPVKIMEDKLYFGKDENAPEIGDFRVNITTVLPTVVSIIGQQSGQTLQPYLAPAGQAILLIEMGQLSPQEMIHQAQAENQMMTWIWRIASLVMMMIGFGLLMSPIVVLADVIPFFGNLVGFGTGLIAFTAGLTLWVICFAIAWFAVRPLFAIGIIVITVMICGSLYIRKKRQINK